MLSEVFGFFDPVGFVKPIAVQGIIIIQSLWVASLDWKTPLLDATFLMWLTVPNILDDQIHFTMIRHDS